MVFVLPVLSVQATKGVPQELQTYRFTCIGLFVDLPPTHRLAGSSLSFPHFGQLTSGSHLPTALPFARHGRYFFHA